MNLYQAYFQWSGFPENIGLANSYRMSFNKIFTPKYGKMDLSTFTKDFVKGILVKSKEHKEFKVKATSALSHVLKWANQNYPGDYPSPDFSYELISAIEKEAEKNTQKKNIPLINKDESFVGGENNITDNTPFVNNDETKDPLVGIDFKESKQSKRESKPEKRNQSYKIREQAESRPVIKIDPVTGVELDTYQSPGAAQRILGIGNIGRAIQRNGVAGGFKWRYADLRSSCKEKEEKKKEITKTTVIPEHPESAADRGSSTVSSSQPANINITNDTKKVKTRLLLLASFTDDELLEEIHRRKNWHGEFTITKDYKL